ncbi:hypothetical protein VTO42DRAFT_524 [Malbranchea cinnamomea]
MGVVKKGSTTRPAAGSKTKAGKRKVLNRPPTRKIVRWNDELDRKLLLCIQSACNTHGIKLPWDEISNLMGNDISEGAIVQHLAKLRVRAVEAGLDVPPPLRRGGTNANSKPAKTGQKKKEDIETDTDNDSDYGEHQRRSRKKPTKRRVNDDHHEFHESEQQKAEDTDLETPQTISSNMEYIATGASFLEYPNDEDSDGENASPICGEESNGATTSARDSCASVTKVVKLRIAKPQFEHIAQREREMDAQRSDIKPKYPQAANVLYGNAVGMGRTEPAPPSSTWTGDFQIDMELSNTAQFLTAPPSWGNPSTTDLHLDPNPTNASRYSLQQSRSQNSHSYHVQQNAYHPIQGGPSSNIATHEGMFGGLYGRMNDQEGAGFMTMNNFDSLQSSGTLSSGMVSHENDPFLGNMGENGSDGF